MIARIAGKRVGLGMSLYMAGGELGRTVGPLVAVWAVTAWGLDGIYRLIVIGWASSLILLWRFSQTSGRAYRQKTKGIKDAIPQLITVFIPLLFITIPRAFLTASITTFLPTFMEAEGASLFLAGVSLSVLEGAGVVGALLSGTISDRVGRKPALLVLMTSSAIMLLVFLQVSGWLLIPVLLLLGFVSLAPQPVLLALVQDHLPHNRAAANGLYMLVSFLVRSLALILLGMAGDNWGLRTTFYGSALIAFLAIPAILALPAAPQNEGEAGEAI
jgi:FSR family fosmidomycin resistance protein-like MFS transporter